MATNRGAPLKPNFLTHPHGKRAIRQEPQVASADASKDRTLRVPREEWGGNSFVDEALGASLVAMAGRQCSKSHRFCQRPRCCRLSRMIGKNRSVPLRVV